MPNLSDLISLTLKAYSHGTYGLNACVLIEQQFGEMVESVLNWTFGFQMKLSANLKISASKSFTSQSRKTLCAMLKKTESDILVTSN